jgi:hypothetical protein
MTNTDFISEQVNIKMFTKFILQLKSHRISFTVLMIQFSSDSMKIEHQPILKQFFYSTFVLTS